MSGSAAPADQAAGTKQGLFTLSPPKALINAPFVPCVTTVTRGKAAEKPLHPIFPFLVLLDGPVLEPEDTNRQLIPNRN